MVTSISGIASFRFTAKKKPAAPPPITAVFIWPAFINIPNICCKNKQNKRNILNFASDLSDF
jgi:hypothetical protein